MKHSLLIFGALVLLVVACTNEDKKASKAATPKASKNTTAFNQAIDSLMQPYYALSAAFVEWDTAAVHAQALQLNHRAAAALGSNALKEVDSAAVQPLTKVAAYASMISEFSLDKGRDLFNRMSHELQGFLRVVQYDNQKLYLQQCPMAFNDTGTGVWISQKEEINNPYLGKKHPRYKAGMLHCGETKELLDVEAGK